MIPWEERVAADDRFRRYAVWSNIPIVTYCTHRLETFTLVEGAKEAHQAAVDFASGRADHHFLTLVGECGRGKTHLSLGVGWEWLESDKGLVKYWQVEGLLDDLRRGFSADTPQRIFSFDELMRRVKTVGLLILDDLGVEQATPFARAKLDEILDFRYINEGKTVITTNLHPTKLERRIASRLKEGTVALLECGDYREIKAKRRKRKEDYDGRGKIAAPRY